MKKQNLKSVIATASLILELSAVGLVHADTFAGSAGRGACALVGQSAVHVDKDNPGVGRLATITQGDGTCIQFHEVEPGEIAVTGYGPKGTLPPSARFPDLNKMDMIDLYERLTDGKAAPAALINAQSRVNESSALAQDPQDEPISQSGEQQSARAIANLIGSDFQSLYCNFAYDFTHCHTNRTGDSTMHEEHATLAEVYANPYRGSIHLQLEYHNVWGWHDSGHFAEPSPLEEGDVGWILGYGSRKDRRGNVHQASGDGYHWVWQGDN